ncbi:MAG: GAF domain-containing protein [Anaerolineae bacterium]|jgi:PAS domain S-box-containing protein
MPVETGPRSPSQPPPENTDKGQRRPADRRSEDPSSGWHDIQHRALFAEALTPILIVDEAGRYIDANPAALEFLECEREELLTKTVWDFAPPHLLARQQEEHAPFVGRRTLETEYLVKGKIKTLLLTVVPVELVGGTVLYGSGQDITERKAAEEALRRRTQQMQALRQIGMELASELDLDTLLSSIVARAVELLDGTVGGLYLVRPQGDALELAVGQGLAPAQSGLLLQAGEGLAGKVWQTGEACIVDDYQRWADRAVVYDEYALRGVVGVPVRWGDRFLGVLGVSSASPRSFGESDVELLSLFAAQAAVALTNARLFRAEQQRRREAEALRRASLALGATLDTGQVLEQVVAQVGTVLSYDAAYIWWLEGETVHIIHWSGRVDAEIAEAIRTMVLPLSRMPALARLATTRRPHVIPDTRADPLWQRLDRMEWILSWAGAPIMAHQEVVGFLSVASATAGRYRPEDAEVLAAFAAHTAVAIGNARVYSLAQQAYDELKEAQSRLVQSARLAAIGELAAGVAHELNNPLTSVLGFSELALHQLEPDHACRPELSIVVDEARRARGIVRNLLDFARQVQPHRLPTDLNEALQSTLGLVQTQLKQDGIQIQQDLDPALKPILLDASQMKQVFLNLITNAGQAMAGGGTLTLRTWQQQDHVCISVGDTGPGIDPETQACIFEPFFTTKRQGTGLGLSVSLGLVRSHGGRIDVESQPGQGSTFTVCLPLEPPEGDVHDSDFGFEMIGAASVEDAWPDSVLRQAKGS